MREGITMIKSPITNSGDIRYFEVIKIFVLISFFFGILSKLFITYSTPLQNASTVMLTVLTTMYIIQLIMASLSELKELMLILKSFVIRLIELPKLKAKELVKVIVESGNLVLPLNENRYLKLNVVRC